MRLALNYLSFAVVATVRALLACRKGYDVIFVHEPSPITVGFPPVALTLATRVPVILWVLDLWPESVSATQAIRSSRVLRWIEHMVRFIYRHCDRILVQSQAFVPHVEQQQVPSEKILYFPSWAEALYEVSDGRLPVPENVYLPEGFRVMFAGNVGAAQDFETVLTAAERVKSRADIHWIIVGDGRMLSWAQAEVERRQLIGTVHFLGRHPLEKLALGRASQYSVDQRLVSIGQVAAAPIGFERGKKLKGPVQSRMRVLQAGHYKPNKKLTTMLAGVKINPPINRPPTIKRSKNIIKL